MAIVYRYSGEEQRTVADGTRWEFEVSVINTTLWQPTGKATNNLVEPDHPERIVGWFTKQALNSKNGSLTEQNSETTWGLLVGKFWAIENGEQKFTLLKNRLIYVENWWEESWYNPGNGLLKAFYPPSLDKWKYAGTGFGSQVDYYTDVVITYWHPANGDPIYTLKIFDANNSEIFSRTEPEPTIQIFRRQETCPPDTCPVDCGDHICCYGSNGIATYSYLK